MRRRQSAGVLSGRRYVSTAINVPVPKYQRTSVSVVDGQAPVGVVESSWLLLVYMTSSLSSVSSLCGGAAPISDGLFFYF